MIRELRGVSCRRCPFWGHCVVDGGVVRGLRFPAIGFCVLCDVTVDFRSINNQQSSLTENVSVI